MSQPSKKNIEDSAVRKGLPIKCKGLTYYPVTMANYETFVSCRDAWALRIGSLPVRYAAKDYLNAVFCFENDEVKEGRAITGLFQRIITLWLLALRIDCNLDDFFRKNIFLRERNNDIEIDHVEVQQGAVKAEISATDFAVYVRPLLAKQNGIVLPDESDNIELVESAEELEEIQGRNKKKLDLNINDLIASVAYQSNVRERDIDDWTVREFVYRRRAIERGLRFKIMAQAEMSGMVTFKNGNPCPSWFADVIDNSYGTVSAANLGRQIGQIEGQNNS